jgi:hypothetical protein
MRSEQSAALPAKYPSEPVSPARYVATVVAAVSAKGSSVEGRRAQSVVG